MALPKASKTRLAIRQSIGYNLGKIIVSTASATGDATSLIDTYGLAKGGTNDYKGNQVQFNECTQATIEGDRVFVASFDSTNKDATVTPTLAAAITAADTYEMWEAPYTIEQVNDKINEAIVAATDDILNDKETHTTVKQADKYEYDCLSSFVGLYRVEYEYDTKIDTLIEDCASVWTESVDSDVTATADTSLFSAGALKLVVADTASATDILATEAITSANISDCDELVFTVYSTVALSAGNLQVLLDNTASCASAVESLNIPATTAYTKTTHVVSLANPTSDAAIISVGVKMVTDKGAFTFYIRDIHAQHSKSRIWKELNPNLWDIDRVSTPLLKLSEDAYATIPDNALIKLTGYAVPDELTADTDTSDIDPDYVIARATALCLMAYGGSRDIDIDERMRRADWWMARSMEKLARGTTVPQPNTRWI